jgi:hypothetical protein
MLDGHRQISEEVVGSCEQCVSVAYLFEPWELAPGMLKTFSILYFLKAQINFVAGLWFWLGSPAAGPSFS